VLRAVLLALIRFYRKGISPFLPPACRYTPSCSEYGLEAVTRYGALKGGWLTVRRLMRCHPWGGRGYDPVPELGGPPKAE
jgi:putative membrane protein insertion efficiency factor